MNDLRYLVYMENQGFRINYRGRSGLIYISCLRRWENGLTSFAHYIKPATNAIWEEWTIGEGANWIRKPYLVEEKLVGFSSRQGQYSFLVFKTTVSDLLAGIDQMTSQAITVTPVKRLGGKGAS